MNKKNTYRSEIAASATGRPDPAAFPVVAVLLVSALLALAVLFLLLILAPAVRAQDDSCCVPTVRLDGPDINYSTVTLVPPTVTFSFIGTDPDDLTGLPAQVRFLLAPGEIDGIVINSRYSYDQHVDQLISFADEQWSEWMPYPADPNEAKIQFSSLPDQQYYLLACQVMDRDGAVSLDRRYGQEVVNFQVRADMFQPLVQLHELYMGTTNGNRISEVAPRQPLNFSWIASAEAYGGTIVSYRHGWDLIDPDDPNDPGWAVPPGTAPANMYAPEHTFVDGYHTFTVRVVDDSQQVAVLTWDLHFIPFIPVEYQYPLLVIDQVIDDNSNRWLGEGGVPSYDREQYREAYWQFLAGPGGVDGFDWNRDHADQNTMLSYQDLVYYRTVLIYARAHSDQLLFNQFRPVNHSDQYVWLAPYQHGGGNLFLVGSRSMESFLEVQNYMTPIIFDTDEEYYELDGQTYVVGFGTASLPDGSHYERGPRQYPFATAGVSLLDWAVPVGKHIYDRPVPAEQDRRSRCSSLKGVVLDPSFKANHLIGPGVVADTIGTDPLIDWRDLASQDSDTLNNEFPFYGEEFIDANISARPTAWTAQECAEGPAGLCIEPMFRGLSRFDWLRERKWAAGDQDWPASTYTRDELESLCGEMALTTLDNGGDPIPRGTARSNGQVYGYLSYRNVADKPSGKADVYWGFDPYRFDHEKTRQAIGWVLDYFGL